ncbi:hypothetical protein ACH4OW_28405 [Streptomyces sp. NPDC017056]|uniref:hypothetical protein n=1 Tax=Streptomyces sp. NPDC017056 TaxID=3364973 RepID=UPI00378BBB92
MSRSSLDTTPESALDSALRARCSAPSLPLPPPHEVAHFTPVRARGGRHRLRRAVRHRRRSVTAGLAMTAAALAATAQANSEGRADGTTSACAAPAHEPPAGRGQS